MAFYLAHLADEKAQSIKEHLSEEKVEEIETLQVDNIPLSQKVFQALEKEVNKPVAVEAEPA